MCKISKYFLLVFLVIFLGSSLKDVVYVEASVIDIVTVKLKNYLGDKTEVTIKIDGEYVIQNEEIEFEQNLDYTVKNENGSLVVYQNDNFVKDFGSNFVVIPKNENNLISINGRRYLGEMEFTIENGFVRPTNKVGIEDYLKGVVPYEMSNYWGSNGGLEALKAQAVAARTFVSRYGTSTVTDTQSHQVYGGYSTLTYTSQAVEETKGQIAKHNGSLISTFYSSTNGGMVLSNTNSWGNALVPYLTTKEDPYDARSDSPYVNWSFTLDKIQIDLSDKDLSVPGEWWETINEKDTDASEINNTKSFLKSRNYIDSKYDIKITEITEVDFDTTFAVDQRIDGRITMNYLLKDSETNEFVMENGEIKVHTVRVNRRAYDIRTMIGSSILRGPYIKEVVDNGPSFTVKGGGWGHGIGMSQYGAYQMSKEGFSYVDILNFYYDKPTIEGGYTVTEVDLDLILTERVSIYNDPLSNISEHSLNPQIVKVTGKWGEWYRINSWLGSIWIKPLNAIEANVEKINKRIDLLERVYLHDYPTTDYKLSSSLSPQSVVATAKSGDWVKIKTWVGEKWIKYTEPIIEEFVNEIILTERTLIYSTSFSNDGQISSLAPQTVNTLRKQGDWYQINSWLGPVWIKPVNEIIEAMDTTLTLTERKDLYTQPNLSMKTGASVSPQEVRVKSKKGDWYQINSWLGPVWIKLK